MVWDAANAWWSTQVVAYNYTSQLRLLDRLGFGDPDWRQLGWLLAAALFVWLGVISWQFSRVRGGGADRLGRAYLRLCARLAQSGAVREPHQGPLAYAAALRGAAEPDEQARELLSRYRPVALRQRRSG